MIKSLILQRLHNGEIAQFISEVIEIIKKNNPDTLAVKKQYDLLKSLLAEMDALYKISTGSAITKEMEQYDRDRDEALYGIQGFINAYSYSPDLELRKQSKLLENHLAIFGSNIQKQNYYEETYTINSIIDDWNKQPELAAALTALNLDSWKTALQTANDKFSSSNNARSAEAGASKTDKLAQKRQEASAAYYKLRDILDAYFTITEGAEPYATVINTINAVIEKRNTLLARRSSGVDETAAAGSQSSEQAS